MRIVMIGSGYVGLVSGACLSEFGHDMVCVDNDTGKIAGLKRGVMPIYEPGLLPVVQQARSRNLFFSTEIEKAIDAADIIFVSVNTPTKTFGEGAGRASDLQYWEKTARTILKASRTLYVEIKHRFISTTHGKKLIDAVRGRGEVSVHGASFFLRHLAADSKRS